MYMKRLSSVGISVTDLQDPVNGVLSGAGAQKNRREEREDTWKISIGLQLLHVVLTETYLFI